MGYNKAIFFLPGGLWNIDKEKTEEMVDIGARVYSACVLNTDKAVYCYSDFPQAQVIDVSVKHIQMNTHKCLCNYFCVVMKV